MKVRVNFAENSDLLFVEKKLTMNGGAEDVYGCADTLISKKSPFIYISNFSKKPVTISAGQSVSRSQNPTSWLDKGNKFTERERGDIDAHANFLRGIIRLEEYTVNKNTFSQTAKSEVKTLQDASRQDYTADEPLMEPPLEGGPKTAEMPEEFTSVTKLLEEVDISPRLTPEQIKQLQGILQRNKDAFGLEGRLGHYSGEVDIPLLPNTKPISIPPFQASPANREVIDKQMDSWIELGVIEPSRSPWGAPVFIAYRNNKPRMVIDLRRLNEQVVADEFPLPRQDEILQSLSLCCYIYISFTLIAHKPDASETLTVGPVSWLPQSI